MSHHHGKSRAAHYHNPIISGYFPDPSICRVGEDYYLITSTFAYAPGHPIFHSRDLVHWEHIGNALSRPSQLPLDGAGVSGGLFAGTIRHHDGVFYVIGTNVSGGGNFIITTRDIRGEWSDPVYFKGADGIDPTIFFDDDGKAWYVGTRGMPEGPAFFGDGEIWLQEIDLSTLSLKGEVFRLWRGALRDAAWAEGPHLYKRDGYYYLMIAEGGTGLLHAVTMARSKDIRGPYEGNPINPILTNRSLGPHGDIVYTGHADLVETPAGDTWMVLLASRPDGGLFCNMGRETFLAPARWENGWLVASPGSGQLEKCYPLPALEPHEFVSPPACEQFDATTFAPWWMSLRAFPWEIGDLSSRPGWLRLALRETLPQDKARISTVLQRQRHHRCAVTTKFEFEPRSESEVAGVLLFQGEDFHIRFEKARGAKGNEVRVVTREAGKETRVAGIAVAAGPLVLRAELRGQSGCFYVSKDGLRWETIVEGVDLRFLCSERASGFVGTCLGVFASGSGSASSNHADFDYFEYQALGQ